MAKYEVSSLININYVNNIPKVVFVCWFGSFTKYSKLMPPNRLNAFKSLVNNINIPVILITDFNYRYFEVATDPIHEMFKYLSGVHKSDYMRGYLLHHYGGGYHDIKYRSIGWENEWDKDNWVYDNNIWIYGRQENKESAIGYRPGMKYIQKEFAKLVTMGWVICKPHTEYTRELLRSMNSKLDEYTDKLIMYPAQNPGGYYAQTPFDNAPPNSYPLRWLEMMGEISHFLMLTYQSHIKFGLPDAEKTRRYK
jgi:hypothetical protein